MKTCWLAVAVAVLLTACAGSAPVPEDRFFQLAPVSPDSRRSTPALNGGLEIEHTQADPLRSGRAVLYSESDRPLQLNRYHYAFWIDQPPRMVQRALVGYLQELGVADRIVTSSRRGRAAHRLQTRLLKFEQQRDGKTTAVEVALQADLQALPGGASLWTRTYTERLAVQGDDMHATAEAMQRALAGVLQALGDDLGSSPGTQ